MEDFSSVKRVDIRRDQQELPPCPKRPAHSSSSALFMPSSTLPLSALDSFPELRQPYALRIGGNNSPLSVTDNNPNININSLSLPHEKPLLTVAPDDDDPVITEILDGVHLRLSGNFDPNMDPKKLRRVISNRVSAQKSKMKKIQHMNELEKQIKALEHEIAYLHPQIAMYKKQQQLLEMEKKKLTQELSSLTTCKMLKDAEIEETKAQVTELRKLHFGQQQQKTLQIHMLQQKLEEQMNIVAACSKVGFEKMMNSSEEIQEKEVENGEQPKA